MSNNETQDERIKRLVAECVERYKCQETLGVSGAHTRWAIAAAVLDTLNAGYRLTDLDCFRLSPLYTGLLKNPEAFSKKAPARPAQPPDVFSEALKKIATTLPVASQAKN